MTNDCPSCTKSYQSEKKLDRHCLKIHGKSLKELRAFCEQGGNERGQNAIKGVKKGVKKGVID